MRDIVKGHGPAARPGETARVQYVGVAWSTGQEFDSSWSRNQAFAFPLGAGQVIQGWDQGVVGMKPGQIVELRPCSSRYQLAQPPVFQTVPCSLRWISAS